MNQRRIIFFSIFGVYHLCIFLFTLYMDAQQADFGLLSKMLYNISLFKYGAMIGLVLFVTDFVWTWRERKEAGKAIEATKHEVNVLKAKVYDYQEADRQREQQAAKANRDE